MTSLSFIVLPPTKIANDCPLPQSTGRHSNRKAPLFSIVVDVVDTGSADAVIVADKDSINAKLKDSNVFLFIYIYPPDWRKKKRHD